MLKNYFKTSWRSIKNQKIVSAINILGLSFGLCTAILITLFINHELSYDTVYKEPDQLYRVVAKFWEKPGTKSKSSSSVPLILEKDFQEYFPEIDGVTGIFYRYGIAGNKTTASNELITFASPNFFENFGFELLQGNNADPLKNLESVVISERTAAKYFPDNNPIGKQITLTFGSIKKSFLVSAVCKNRPENVSMIFDVLINFDNAAIFKTNVKGVTRLNNRGDFSARLFLRIQNEQIKQYVENEIDKFTDHFFAAEYDDYKTHLDFKEGEKPFYFSLQPVKNIRYNKEVYGGRSVATIYLLAGIASIILLIASINFTNLAIGRSSVRRKEIGMRKIIGATKVDIFWQFITEAFLTSLFAMSIGLVMAYLLIPQLNQVANKSFDFSSLLTLENIVSLGIVTLLVTLLSGAYPSLLLSKFSPIEVLRKRLKINSRNFFTRGLIICQFSLSILLVTVTFVLDDQISFMLNQNTGFEKKNKIAVDLQETNSAISHTLADQLTASINNVAGVKKISRMSSYFGSNSYQRSYIYDKNERYMVHRFNVDYNMLENFKMELLAGRFFDKKRSLDSSSVVINEALAKKLGGINSIGKEVKLFGKIKFNVIGILKDYNFESLHKEVTPAILYARPDMYVGNLVLDIEAGKDAQIISALEKIWKSVIPDKPLSYSYIDEDFASLYSNDEVWSTVLNFSSILTIIIALMGVLGLTLLTISKKRKEISIRKVLGATTQNIVNLISRQFIVLVVLANLVALPAAILITKKLLENYHYKIELSSLYFIIGTIVTVAITYLVSAVQGLIVSLSNQSDILREE